MGKTLAYALPMPPLPLGPQVPLVVQQPQSAAGGGSSSIHSAALKRPSSSTNTADQDTRVDVLNDSEAALLSGREDGNHRKDSYNYLVNFLVDF